MKGNKRVVSICLSDIPKEKMNWWGKPEKAYISLTIWDNDYPNHLDQDCVVQVTQTAEEVINNIPPIKVGGGLIHRTR
jgi:hypothetical protein